MSNTTLPIIKPSDISQVGTYIAVDMRSPNGEHPAARFHVVDIWRNAKNELMWHERSTNKVYLMSSSAYKDDKYVFLGPVDMGPFAIPINE